MKKVCCFLLISTPCLSCEDNTVKTASKGEFPSFVPVERPDRPLSNKAVARNYDEYMSLRAEQNELYTQFKYINLKGFNYNGGNGTIATFHQYWLDQVDEVIENTAWTSFGTIHG